MTTPYNFSRLESLIGLENLEKLKNKTVLIIGIGGVGGYVCESLARSGIGKILLVDFDKVEVTNINRQIIALNSTIGKKKVDVMKKRLQDINDNLDIECFDIFLDKENIESVFKEKIDYVVDACDTVSSKKILIHKCLEEKIPLISSMGTAKKLEPSLLEITSIKKTINDPLARIIRKYMKDEENNQDLTVLSSTEIPKKTKELASNSFVPSVAGLLIGDYVVKELIKKEF